MHKLSIFVLMIVIYSQTVMVHAAPFLIDYVYKEGFESGSVGSWSSYPPAQDTAYDPTIWIKPINQHESNKALFREITPNYEIDCIFGVRKKLDIYVERSSILSFKCYIKSNRKIDGVRVRFGFSDGTMTEKMIEFNECSTWLDVRFSLDDILQKGTCKHLDAVAFMAVCPNADPENLLRFGLDYVMITGKCEAPWKFSEPVVHYLDEWSEFIVGRHFTEGETITIQGTPPFFALSVEVTLSQALTGEDAKNYSMRLLSGNNWSVTIPLDHGIWRASLNAVSREKKGDTCMSSLVFLVKRKDAPDQNPRLLMGPDDAPEIMKKAAVGRMKKIWEDLQHSAREYRAASNVDTFTYNLTAYDDIYWLPTYYGYINAIQTPARYIRSNGVVYALSNDPEAGDAACRALVQMSQWPTYVHPHILKQGQFSYWPVGQILIDFALGFDMVSGRFNPEERKTVAEALYTKGITEIFKEYVRDNRVSSHTSNWISDVTSGGILCALAILDDYPGEKLEPYLTSMILKLNALIMNTFGKDGSYGEGFDYLQRHTMKSMTPALAALDRTFGIRFPDKLRTGYKSVLYQIDSSTKKLYDFGDTRTHYTGSSHFSYLIAHYRDPYLKWLYDLEPGTADVDLFLMDDSVPAKGPEALPTTALFRDTGTAIFRSGFDHEDFVFVFRCGPFYNHQHFDQGTFFLSDMGEEFITEPGKSHYYEDPWYQKMVIQPGGHNCILVDGNPESQCSGDFIHDVPAWNDYAIITDFVTYDEGAFVSGCLDPIYKAKLSLLRRSILYSAPRTIVVIDEAVSAGDAKRISLRFHAPRNNDISINGREAIVKRPGGNLTIHTSAPLKYHSALLKRPLTLFEFADENAVTMKARGFLELSTDLGEDGAVFVNVLTTDNNVISALNEQVYDDHIVLSAGEIVYSINTTCGKRFVEGNVTTDARVYADKPTGFIAFRCTEVIRDGKVVLDADKPVSLQYKDGVVNYSAAAYTRITMKTVSRPLTIMLNGRELENWEYHKEIGVTIQSLPAGSDTLVFR